MPEGRAVVIYRKIDGAFISAICRLITGCGGSGLGVVIVAAVVLWILYRFRSQVDDVIAAGGVILGFGENPHHILMSRQNRIGHIGIGADRQACKHQRFSAVGVIGQGVGIHFLAVDCEPGEVSRAENGEGGLRHFELQLGDGYTIGGCIRRRIANFVCKGHTEEYSIHRRKGIGDGVD